MAYTSHGWWYGPGEPAAPPRPLARCGGPGLCGQCSKEATKPPPRRFQLVRDVDVSGVSGTGVVAEGVLWTDGTATVRWLSDRPSTVHWGSIDDALAIHGHGGKTRVEWLDR